MPYLARSVAWNLLLTAGVVASLGVAITRAACSNASGCGTCFGCAGPVGGDLVFPGGGGGVGGGGTLGCWCDSTTCENSSGADCERCIECAQSQTGYFACQGFASIENCEMLYLCSALCCAVPPAWQQPLAGGTCGEIGVRHCYMLCE